MASIALAPASASASSILSGYGGPGQGTQAILGSTLLNGPSGGAGGPQGAAATAATPVGAGSSSTAGGGGGGASATHGRAGASRHSRQAASTRQGAERRLPTLAISRASSGGSGVLGLSDTAFLVVLLALGALVFTGLLTRGLAKQSGTRGHAGS
ncbi:MAG TPA: hypothetical protein VGO14_11445 [Solirubrobacteraceae bacterium]|nr:hypothetical protein [Solirubrobacteraceae bacterium]